MEEAEIVEIVNNVINNIETATSYLNTLSSMHNEDIDTSESLNKVMIKKRELISAIEMLKYELI